VPVTVQNTGSVESDFVVLLFLNSTAGPAPYPAETLVSYKRAHNIQPGADAQLNLIVKVEALTRVDDTGSRALYPGDYTFFVDIDKKATFQVHLVGKYTAVEEFPQLS
jgi:beta-D-xylosidase 4